MPGFETDKLRRARLLLIGCGGLIGEIAVSLARKGVGELVLCDSDRVELSNLSRQKFYAKDLHRPKALALAENVSNEGFLGTSVTGHEIDFSAESAPVLAADIDAVLCGVDNNHSRAIASQYFGQRNIPVLFAAVNERADYVWVYLQLAASPCVACVFPRIGAALQQREPCRNVPSSIDILKVSAGLVSYALNSVLMEQPRHWTYADYSFTSSNHVTDTPQARPNCLLCGSS